MFIFVIVFEFSFGMVSSKKEKISGLLWIFGQLMSLVSGGFNIYQGE